MARRKAPAYPVPGQQADRARLPLLPQVRRPDRRHRNRSLCPAFPAGTYSTVQPRFCIRLSGVTVERDPGWIRLVPTLIFLRILQLSHRSRRVRPDSHSILQSAPERFLPRNVVVRANSCMSISCPDLGSQGSALPASLAAAAASRGTSERIHGAILSKSGIIFRVEAVTMVRRLPSPPLMHDLLQNLSAGSKFESTPTARHNRGVMHQLGQSPSRDMRPPTTVPRPAPCRAWRRPQGIVFEDC